MRNAKQHTIFANDGQDLALWCIEPDSFRGRDTLLIHGTFSNRSAFRGLTQYLRKEGHRCWILEWRGHGASGDAKSSYDMETVGRYDIPATFEFLKSNGVEKFNCVTHSGGGLALTIFLAIHQHEQHMINSLTMFACQAFGASDRKRNFTRVFLGKHISRMMGFVPGKFAGVKGENESYYMMQQWFNWNLSGRFLTREGEDLSIKMREIKTPIFAICAEGDKYIAPSSGCQAFLDCFDNPENRFLRCGTSNGFSEDFNHSRILQSRNAANEVWPKLLDWIGQNHDPT